MCGIAGGLSYQSNYFPSRESIEDFSAPLKFRGPDDSGLLFEQFDEAFLTLAHKRLSIIDLTKGGHQPMKSSSGQSLITFNGEIYNYQELRELLTKAGFVFKTNSDTEVILNGYECWGIDKLMSLIDGMFAFAIFDKKERNLILARDRFGKKPLYYYHIKAKSQLAFSSDIRSFNFIGINKTFNNYSFGYFLSEQSTPQEQSIWNEINKVVEGTYLKFDINGIESFKYWNLDYQNTNLNISRDLLLEETERLLLASVRKRLVSDVRVSALLSGGVDSSIVVAMMATLSKERVKTYSVGFEDDNFNELAYARKVAKKYDTDHSEIIMKASDLSIIDTLIDEFGEPFADSSMIPTYLVSNAISKYDKVALSGDGGDEMFAGYYEYYLVHKLSQIKIFKPFERLIQFVSQHNNSYGIGLISKLLELSKLKKHQLLNRNYSFTNSELKELTFNNLDISNSVDNEHLRIYTMYGQGNNTLKSILSSSLHTRLVNDYLVKVDRASMYSSLEIRSPFLDKDLAQYIARQSQKNILSNNEPKSILKEVAERYLPSDILYRKKRGFEIPLESWLKNELKNEVKEVILGGKQNVTSLNYTFIEEMIKKFNEGHLVDKRKIWTLFVFHKWCQLG